MGPLAWVAGRGSIDWNGIYEPGALQETLYPLLLDKLV